jgi:hypothetical protein
MPGLGAAAVRLFEISQGSYSQGYGRLGDRVKLSRRTIRYDVELLLPELTDLPGSGWVLVDEVAGLSRKEQSRRKHFLKSGHGRRLFTRQDSRERLWAGVGIEPSEAAAHSVVISPAFKRMVERLPDNAPPQPETSVGETETISNVSVQGSSLTRANQVVVTGPLNGESLTAGSRVGRSVKCQLGCIAVVLVAAGVMEYNPLLGWSDLTEVARRVLVRAVEHGLAPISGF